MHSRYIDFVGPVDDAKTWSRFCNWSTVYLFLRYHKFKCIFLILEKQNGTELRKRNLTIIFSWECGSTLGRKSGRVYGAKWDIQNIVGKSLDNYRMLNTTTDSLTHYTISFILMDDTQKNNLFNKFIFNFHINLFE